MRAITQRLTRLESAAARMAGAALPAPVSVRPAELAAIAQQLTQNLKDAVEGYMKVSGLSRPEALARATAPCPGADDSVRRIPPDLVSWSNLQTLYRNSPDDALAKWLQM